VSVQFSEFSHGDLTSLSADVEISSNLYARAGKRLFDCRPFRDSSFSALSHSSDDRITCENHIQGADLFLPEAVGKDGVGFTSLDFER